jgi:hypothetical protein
MMSALLLNRRAILPPFSSVEHGSGMGRQRPTHTRTRQHCTRYFTGTVLHINIYGPPTGHGRCAGARVSADLHNIHYTINYIHCNIHHICCTIVMLYAMFVVLYTMFVVLYTMLIILYIILLCSNICILLLYTPALYGTARK